MLYSIKGKLISKKPFSCVIRVSMFENSHMDFELVIPLSTYEHLGEEGSEEQLFVYPAYVKGELVIYGFKTQEDRMLFTRLIKLIGIGPSLAVRLLSGMNAEELLAAISNEDLKRLAGIKGVGKKRAERLIFELKGKLPEFEKEHKEEARNVEEQAIDALIALGLKPKEAEIAVKKVLTGTNNLSVEDIIKQALSQMK